MARPDKAFIQQPILRFAIPDMRWQAAGFVGGLLVLLIGLPTAVKMGALAVPTESGEMLSAFERYRKRQAWVSSVSGVLALLALFAGTVL